MQQRQLRPGRAPPAACTLSLCSPRLLRSRGRCTAGSTPEVPTEGIAAGESEGAPLGPSLGPLLWVQGAILAAFRGFTRARNLSAIWGIRRLTGRLLSGHAAARASRGMDLLLAALRRSGLTGLSDAAVATDLLVLRRAYLAAVAQGAAGGLWPGTGEEAGSADLEELAHFAKFATAAYGAVFLAAMSPRGRGTLRSLLWQLGTARLRDLATIRRHCGLEPSDLVHFQEGGPGAFRPAWFLAWDQEREAAVLTVRGTANVDEALTDCVCDVAPFEGGFAHRGFLESAVALREQVDGPLQQLIQERRPRRLVVCGHSLGGACAVLLAVSLHREQQSGTTSFLHGLQIKCLTYGCPPTMLVRPDKADILPDILNVAYRFDWVPRAQLSTVLRLVESIGRVEALGFSIKQKASFAAGRSELLAEHGLRFRDLYPASPGGRAGEVSKRTEVTLCLVGRCLWMYDACAGFYVRTEVADAKRLSEGPPFLEDPVRAAFDHSPLQYEVVLRRACGSQAMATPQVQAAGRLGAGLEEGL